MTAAIYIDWLTPTADSEWIAPVGRSSTRRADDRPLASANSSSAIAGWRHGFLLRPAKLAPSWLNGFTAASRRLAALPIGWDGPGSIPASHTTLYNAERITRQALEGFADAATPYLVPAGDGSVQVEWHGEFAEIELTIDPHGSLFFWGRDHLTGAVQEGENDQARALFFDWAPRFASPVDDGADEVLSSQPVANAA